MTSISTQVFFCASLLCWTKVNTPHLPFSLFTHSVNFSRQCRTRFGFPLSSFSVQLVPYFEFVYDCNKRHIVLQLSFTKHLEDNNSTDVEITPGFDNQTNNNLLKGKRKEKWGISTHFHRENPKDQSLTAGHVKKRAVNGGDPEVGGACVKQHSELLWGGTNADLPEVLGLWKQKRLIIYHQYDARGVKSNHTSRVPMSNIYLISPFFFFLCWLHYSNIDVGA